MLQGDEWQMNLDHSHNPSELKTILSLRENSQEAVTEVSLKRQGKDTLNLAAEAKLSYPGRQMSYEQTLIQTNNVFNHDITVKVDSRDKFTLRSVYKMGRRHEASADVNVEGYRPVHVEGFVQPDLSDFAAEAKLRLYHTYTTNLEWQVGAKISTTSDLHFNNM